jgi:hypothetical protein
MKSNQLPRGPYHPSFLALDRAHLGYASAEVSAHVTACDVCQSYVEEPGSTATASGFVALKQAIGAREQRRRSWLWLAAPLVAVACGLLLFMTTRGPGAIPGEDVYVGAKGFRSVWIYVKHGTDTELWDGKRALSLGDRLRLKVDPGSYHYVAVYSLTQPAAPQRLYAGPLSPGQNLTLPDAWEIDDSLLPEQLYVVFSDAEVEPAWEEWLQGRVPKAIAVLPFSLPKAGSAGADAGLHVP